MGNISSDGLHWYSVVVSIVLVLSTMDPTLDLYCMFTCHNVVCVNSIELLNGINSAWAGRAGMMSISLHFIVDFILDAARVK